MLNRKNYRSVLRGFAHCQDLLTVAVPLKFAPHAELTNRN